MRNLLNTIPYFFLLLFIYLVIAVHIVLPTPGGNGLYLSTNIISWIFITLLISAGLWQIVKRQNALYSRIHLLGAIGLLLLCIPLFYQQPFSHFAIPRLLAIAAGLLLLLALSQLRLTKEQKFTLLFILLVGIAIEALIGLIQFYLLMPFELNIIGYTPLFGRPYGSFTQPNVMASFMATGVALAIYLLTQLKMSKQHINKMTKALIYFCLVTCPLLVILLQSKTGFLGLATAFALSLPSFIKDKPQRIKIFTSILLGTVIGLISMNLLQEVNRGEALYQDKHRATMYSITAQMIIEKPISGVGYGNFERSYREFHIKQLAKDKDSKCPTE